MKKLLHLIITFFVFLFVTACSQEAEPSGLKTNFETQMVVSKLVMQSEPAITTTVFRQMFIGKQSHMTNRFNSDKLAIGTALLNPDDYWSRFEKEPAWT